MTEDEFDDRLAGLTPEQRVEARAALDELADAVEAASMIEGHILSLQARLAKLADATAAGSPNHAAREYARRSMSAQVALAMRVHPSSASAQLAIAEQIHDDSPAILESMRDGKCTRKHAEQVARAGANLDAGGRASLDQNAVPFAETRTPGELRRILAKQAADLAPRTLRERHAEARTERRITITDLDDGMSELLLLAPTLETHALHDRLTQMGRAIKVDRSRARSTFRDDHGYLPEDGWTAPVSGEVDGGDAVAIAATDRRTMDQIRVDLLLDLLLTAAPSGHDLVASGTGSSLSDVRASVHVTIPTSQLIDPDDGAAWIDGGALISPDTARIVAGNTVGWERIFHRPVDGAITAVDHYRPTAAQRRALVARDMTCRFPGCRVPAHRCDVDHAHDYARGGTTELSNLESLCAAHHQMKHQDAWGVRQVGGGVLEWTSPTGRVVTDEPISRVFFQETPGAAELEQERLAAERAREAERNRAEERREVAREQRAANERSAHSRLDGDRRSTFCSCDGATSHWLATGDDRVFGWTAEEFLEGLTTGTIVDPERVEQ